MIRFRTVFLILLVLSILLILSPFLLGLASTALTYEGKCHGFTDGVRDCTWMEYAQNEFLWSFLILLVPGAILLSNWPTTLGFWLFKRRTASPDKLSIGQAVLIPVISCVVGCGLISVLSSIPR